MSMAGLHVADIGSDLADLAPSTDRYAQRFSGPTGNWLLSRQTNALRTLIAPWPGSEVLDVGGGHGQIAAPLIADGHIVRVHASCEAALGRARRLDPQPDLGVGPLMPLPYPDRSFDVVTSFRLLAHIGDWQGLLDEFCRVARKAVIVDFPIPAGANTFQPILLGLKKSLETETRSFATIATREIVARGAANGFPLSEHIGQFVLPMVVHRTLRQPWLSERSERLLASAGLAHWLGSPVVLALWRPDI
ncbi:hypothetical protein OCH239_17365 [Roseivivax halodurans JCM 10272]|uniref:Methyltransferase type 11 domain-containing protein n=1 Tax=Roseivivax halodurans JCM 10272 TaxID=1449350 RepID=X7E9V1_9RHOB|nr:class I SAM-dependent methyltransferase [Roseivivax halodurans]ETX12737.1 hypothetical protein OCH239_17365 [Roseivivax halodurans JCM 10272]